MTWADLGRVVIIVCAFGIVCYKGASILLRMGREAPTILTDTSLILFALYVVADQIDRIREPVTLRLPLAVIGAAFGAVGLAAEAKRRTKETSS